MNDKLVVDHLPLVRAIALTFRHKVPANIEHDDLVNAGIIGLLDAAAKFKEGQENTFATYARFRIKGAIIDSLRSLDPAGRTIRRANRTVAVSSRKLTAAFGRMPVASEIANDTGIPEARLRSLAVATANASAIVGRTAPEDTVPVARATAAETDPSWWCSQSQLSSLLATAIATLPERHGKVIRQSYFEDRSNVEISGNLGVHETRIGQLRAEALTRMAVALRRAGIRSAREALAEIGVAA